MVRKYSTPKKVVSKSPRTLRRSPRIVEQSKTKEIVSTQASFGDNKVKGKGVYVDYGIEDDVFWGQACTQASAIEEVVMLCQVENVKLANECEDECHPIDDPSTPMDDENIDDVDLSFLSFCRVANMVNHILLGKVVFVPQVIYDSGEEGELFPEFEEVEDISDGEVRVGLQFSDNLDFKRFLRQYAVRNQLQYKFLKSDNLRIRVVCKFKETYNCGFFIYARKLPRVKTFKIKGFSENHNCVGDKFGRNRSANPGFVTEHVLEKMKISTTTEIPKARQIEDEFWTSHNTCISYNVAWRARNIVLEMRNGSYNDSYRLVPSMVEMINKTNPGSVANFTYERYCSHYYTTAAYKATYAHAIQLLDNFEDWEERPRTAVDGSTFIATNSSQGESSTSIGEGRGRGGKSRGSKVVGGRGASFFRSCFQATSDAGTSSTARGDNSARGGRTRGGRWTNGMGRSCSGGRS
ncbi:hypothetical protein MKX01_015880 [Papaver californicum]|nr:hypothetical protein MKX01_015880 [Papaver californicum]